MNKKLTPKEIADNKAADQKIIQDMIIETQAKIAAVNNKIDAFGREYDSATSNAQIYIWTNSIEGTIRKVKSSAKSLLTGDGKPKTLSVGPFNIDVTFTTPGLALDSAKLKKLDFKTYEFIAKKFPKNTAPRATVKITEKKGYSGI